MHQQQMGIQVTPLIPVLTNLFQGYLFRTSTPLGAEVLALRDSSTKLRIPMR